MIGDLSSEGVIAPFRRALSRPTPGAPCGEDSTRRNQPREHNIRTLTQTGATAKDVAAAVAFTIAEADELSRPKSDDRDDDLNRAVDFLATVATGGLIAVVAIPPDGGGATGATFQTVGESKELRGFLEAHAGKAGLYYTLNQPKPVAEQTGKNGRLREADVAAIRGIVVDLDPNPAVEATEGGYERERERLLSIATSWRHNVFASATAAIDSGNGVQIVWLFAEPLPNDPATRDRVKAQAKGLGDRLGGDRVHSIEHPFRIPFTENVPNAKKLAKGRKRTRARLIYFSPDTTATLADLNMAAPPAPVVEHAPIDPIDLDYAAVLAAASGEPLPAHLGPYRDALAPLAASLAGSNRSDRDFAIAARCIEEGLTNPTELAQVVFAVAPERLLEDGDRGRGEYYASHTITKALGRTRPKPQTQPDTWFTGAPAIRAEAWSVSSLCVVRGLVNPQKIGVRQWLVQPRLPIGDVCQCTGEPGISKSTLALRDALIVSTGREDLLRGAGANGSPISDERLHASGPVVIYNAEDRLDEMQRRLAAAQRHYGLTDQDMIHAVILWSGVDHGVLKIMERRNGDRGALTRADGADHLEETIRAHGAILAVLDPQISLLVGGQENSNDDADSLMQALAVMAARCRASITVVHHTSKATRGAAGDMGAGRGGFAAVGKVRSAFTLTNVTGLGAGEAAWGATAEEQLIRLDFSKTSHDRKPREPIVFRRRSAPVGNGSVQDVASAADHFAGTPREQLQARGDFAPVLELVDIKARIAATANQVSEKEKAGGVELATLIDGLMGDQLQVKLSDIRDDLADLMRDKRMCRATSRNTVDSHIKRVLGDGVDIDNGGQSVRIRLGRVGRGPTAPLHVIRDPVRDN